MGFGTLFVFYIVSFILSFNPYGSFFRLVGYLGMLLGLWELQQYQKTFLYAVYTSPALIAVAAYQVCGTLQTSFGIPMPFVTETVTGMVNYVGAAAILFFHAALLYAIWSIAREIGLPRIMQGAIRNGVLIGIYYLLYFLTVLPISWPVSVARYVAPTAVLLMFAWAICNAVLIYTCYKNICKEGDEDVPLRVSRFAFVNKIRQELERKEQAGIDATVEHAKKNRQQHAEGQAKNRELRIKYAERRDKMQKHKNEKKKKK